MMTLFGIDISLHLILIYSQNQIISWMSHLNEIYDFLYHFLKIIKWTVSHNHH